MFVLGLVLILLAAGSLIAVLASGTDDQAALYGGSLDLPTFVVFLAGAAALLLFIMGLELVRSGIKRANTNRKNTRKLRKLEKQRAGTSTAGARPASTTGATSDTTGGTNTGATTGTGEPAPGPPGTTAPGSSGAEAERGPYQTPPPAR